MTLAIAWVGKRSDGREDLYFASDSRTRGGMIIDATPKIVVPVRGDCALCFAGDTAATYPLMLHIEQAISAHAPAKDRNLDLKELKSHLLRVCTDIVSSVKEKPLPLEPSDVQFIFGGYSWREKDFCVWTFYYEKKEKKFRARPTKNFHRRLFKAAFIGDWASIYRQFLVRALNQNENGPAVDREPLTILSCLLKKAKPDDTIGGAPQVVRVGSHMNTRPFCVKWGGQPRPYLFGRQLFEYENCDYWTIDPNTGKIEGPRHFRFDKGEDPEIL